MAFRFRFVIASWLLLVPAAAGAQDGTIDVRRLSVDEAVRLALEHNLGIRVARLSPQVEDLAVAQARAAWAPSFTSTLQGGSTESPNNSFLSGAQGESISDARVATNVGIEQNLRWGGRYSLGWDATRATTTNIFANFSPQVRSSLAFSYRQPLLRGLRIDTARQQLLIGEKNREIADAGLRQSMATTARAVRLAYWDLAFARASRDVQAQSLELAQESLRNTRARVEVGTIPPIDVVEAEAEVATREEAVIVAEAQIQTAEDSLRTLVYSPEMAGFWSLRLIPSDAPAFEPRPVDVDAAARAALEQRTDLAQARRTLESNDIALRFLRDRTLPDVTASLDYGLTGLGGTQFVRGAGFPGPVVGQTVRGFGSVLGDLVGNDYPNWTASLTMSYPLGATADQAGVARARLQRTQAAADLRNRELQVVTQVREAARQVQTNERRVLTTRASRALAERRLDAEQRKLAAGTSTAFFVFQAQRDLAQARNNELRATLDHRRSLIDLETVQEAPLR